MPFIRDFHPTAGFPDFHTHSRSPDIHVLILFQRLRHIKIHFANIHQNFQIFPGFLNLNVTLLIHLGKLCAVQINPCEAFLFRIHLVTAVKSHILHRFKLLQLLIPDSHASVHPRQLHCSSLSLIATGCTQHRDKQQQYHQTHTGNSLPSHIITSPIRHFSYNKAYLHFIMDGVYCQCKSAG